MEVLNKAIWCTIFHHVKYLTACLLGCLFFTLEQDSQKVEGPCPQPEKWRGHWPPFPGSVAYVYSVKQSLKLLEVAPDFSFSFFFFLRGAHSGAMCTSYRG